MVHLTDDEFAFITERMLREYGINLTKKRGLIEARLAAVLAARRLDSFTDYFSLLSHSEEERTVLVNRLTTNHTGFLREEAHFAFLTSLLQSGFAPGGPRIWSAGCSSGEEPYSAAMTLCDFYVPGPPPPGAGLLATDISQKALAQAREGIYAGETLATVPAAWKSRYFIRQPDGLFSVRAEVKRLVRFQTLNLMDTFPFIRRFDLIFCRNVMIYFTQPTREVLADRFFEALRPGGYLLIGHSEMLPRGKIRLSYIKPSVYRRPTED